MQQVLSIILLAVLGVVGIQEYSPHEPITEKITFKFNESVTTLSADGLQLISFGYSRVLSNLLWLRFLQHTPTEKVPKGELSWIYFDLDAITTIDPDFLPVFETASIFLSVVTDDKKGAELLLKKGVALHPDRWRIRSHLAYHLQFELQDPEAASIQYLEAAKLPGAPTILGIVGAGLFGKKGDIGASVAFLEQMQSATLDPNAKKVLQERIEHWKKKQLGEGKGGWKK